MQASNNNNNNNGGAAATRPAATATPAPSQVGPGGAAPVRSRAWALINNTRRQHVDIGAGGVHFERDPIRYMRTVLSLGWSADDDMVMLPARHMPAAYTEALVWPVASDDAASASSSSSSSGSGSDWDDGDDSDSGDAYSSDYDSDTFSDDDNDDEGGGANDDGGAKGDAKTPKGSGGPTAVPPARRVR